MTQSIPRARRIEILLNTLAEERYARRSLLGEVIEELADRQDHPTACAARALLGQLDMGIDDRAYAGAIERLRAMSGVDGVLHP